VGLLLVISAAAAARCHDKREQLPNDCACMLHVHTLTRYVGLGCQKGGLAKTGLAGRFCCPSHVIEKEILVHPPSHTHCHNGQAPALGAEEVRGKLLIEDQESENGGKIRPSLTW